MVKPAFKYIIDRFVHRPEISNELFRKLEKFGYSYMEAKIATAGEALTASNYWVANFKLGEITLNSNWKIEKS